MAEAVIQESTKRKQNIAEADTVTCIYSNRDCMWQRLLDRNLQNRNKNFPEAATQ
jgi:hypothetical protein